MLAATSNCKWLATELNPRWHIKKHCGTKSAKTLSSKCTYVGNTILKPILELNIIPAWKQCFGMHAVPNGSWAGFEANDAEIGIYMYVKLLKIP